MLNRNTFLNNRLSNVFETVETTLKKEDTFRSYESISEKNVYDITDFGNNNLADKGILDYEVQIKFRGRLKMKDEQRDIDTLKTIENIRSLEKEQFELLLDLYLNNLCEQGKSLLDGLLDLYEKGIISGGVVKKKASINEYEFLYELSKRGYNHPTVISKEEEQVIIELGDIFKC